MVRPKRPIRVYVDTSVVGGCLDVEFRLPSLRVFDRSREGDALLVLSDITLAELATAPQDVRDVLENLPKECIELVSQDTESDALAEDDRKLGGQVNPTERPSTGR